MKNYHPNKILILSTEFPPGPGGIGNHAWNLAKSLNTKVDVEVLTVSDYADNIDCKTFDKLEKFKITRFKRNSFSPFTYIHRIIKLIITIRQNNYSHCIISGFFSLIVTSIICIINKDIIKVGVLHGSELIQQNLLQKLLLNSALKKLDVIISVSNFTNQLIPIKILQNQKRFIIPNGVNENLLTLKSVRINPIKLEGYPCLLTVGSITERKGQTNLLKALPTIQTKYPNVHYHCVGLPIEKEKFLKEVNKLEMNNFVTIHGVIANNQLSNIYKQADILVMLSGNKNGSCVEGFGIAILEANLFGVPALGSKNTGIEDAIVNKKTGILADPFSINEIIDGIDLILQKRDEYSKNLINWALEHSWSNISNQYLKAIINA